MLMMQDPLVSIITPAFNAEGTIGDTLSSVAVQSYPLIEHFVMDGASNDQTRQIVAQFNKVRFFSDKDEGVYDAMNKGITVATGDIIGILNSDDLYASTDVVEQVVQTFQESGADAIYGDLDYVRQEDTNKVVRRWRSGYYQLRNWRYGWMPPHPTFFVKRSVYERFGMFNLALTSAADYELMLRFCVVHHIQVAYLPKVLVKMREGGQSNATIQGRIKANREDGLAWKMNGFTHRGYIRILKPMRKLLQWLPV